MMTQRGLTGRRRRTFFLVFGLALLLPAAAAAQSGAGEVWVEGEPVEAGDAPLKRSSISQLVERSGNAVVNVIVTYGASDFEAFLQQNSPAPDEDGPRGMGQGSGFIIHPSGYVLTNHHVVDNANKIKVRLKDESEYRAEVVGVDPKTDIALMQIEADRRFPAMPLGDSEGVQVGDPVVAIGNPLGLHHSVTSGIVSALSRRNLGIQGDKLYTDFIQVDAPINPGNSGGPLVNFSGQAIGINTAINRQGQGIGFAIPINMVKALLPQLKKDGYVTRSWLGARVQPLTEALAKSFEMESSKGALITEVVDGSPAAKAGLSAGDVITSFDGKTIRSSEQLPWMVATAGPERTVPVNLLRDGNRETLKVTLEKHPEQDRPDIPKTERDGSSESSNLEVRVKNLTASLARQLGANSKAGVVVTQIGEHSPAKGAGLRQRDVITEIGKRAIESKKDFQTAIDALQTGEIVRLKLVRGGRVVYIAFER